MFSENEILIQCRQCRGHCDEIKKCPLKTEWPSGNERKIFPVIPCKWDLSLAGKCLYLPANDKYTTEELISGLSRLNGHL